MMKVLVLLFLITIVLKYMNTCTEGYACISREYVKVEEEDEDVQYHPIQSFFCPNLSDDECKDYKADCVKVDIDEEIFENDSHEANELTTMLETCLKKETHVKMDERCLKALLTLPKMSKSRFRDKSKPLNLDNCFLKNKETKYVFDDKCELL
jgi:hypothetical protein